MTEPRRRGSDGPAPAWIIRIVESLVDDAVTWSTDEIYARYGEMLAPLGTRGRLYTKQDVHYHLEFLLGTLMTGADKYFADYVRWLAGVLESRGMPVSTLSESLRILGQFFEQRLDPVARAPVMRVLRIGLDVLDGTGAVSAASVDPADAAAPLDGVDELTRSLIDGDIAAVRAIVMRAHQAEVDYLQIATRLFQPSLYTVGQLWEQNKITVAQEHLATAISQTILTQVFVRSDFAPPTPRKALFACAEGNHHALGLRMVSDAFELRGWSVQFLGGNVPTDALLAQVDRFRPDVVALSASMVQHLPTTRRSVAEIRASFGANRPSVFVGGLATNQFDDIWRWVGADAWCSDANEAVEMGT